MNRRGDVPLGVMVIIALVLCGFALATFLMFKSDFGGIKNGEYDVAEKVKIAEEYSYGKIKSFVLNNYNKSDIKKEVSSFANRNYYLAGTEQFFAKMKNGEFEFYKEGENYIFEMKNVSFYAEIGSGELKGTSFKLSKDIVLVFDGKGNYRELR